MIQSDPHHHVEDAKQEQLEESTVSETDVNILKPLSKEQESNAEEMKVLKAAIDAAKDDPSYWAVDYEVAKVKGDELPELVWNENPYYGFTDSINFIIEKWHTKEFTIEEIVFNLCLNSTGMNDPDEDWTFCRNIVYYNDTPIIEVSMGCNVYTCHKDEYESNGELKAIIMRTRRMIVRGCDHHKRYCVKRATKCNE